MSEEKKYASLNQENSNSQENENQCLNCQERDCPLVEGLC